MGGAEFPPRWLFGLRRPSTGGYRLFAGANGRLWEGSWSTSQNFCCLCSCPCSEPQPPPTSARDSPTLASRSGSVSYGVTAPSPWVLMCTLLCVCSTRVESLFPSVLSKSCHQIPLAFKVWFSGNSSSPCRTPRLGSLTWNSVPSLQWMDFCGISVLQFVSHPPSGYGIWFYCDCTPPTVPLQLLLCLWMWGIFFGEFQCLPVNDCSAFSCVLVLSQEGVSACPSTPLSWVNPLSFSLVT